MSSVAFFGKMSQAADFVRWGVSDKTMRSFEDWFHDAYTELRGAGERGLKFRCHIILPVADGDGGVVAAVATPSRDRIGREFPMVVATWLPRSELPPSQASLAIGFSRFWDAAHAASEAHRDQKPDTLWDALESVSSPSAAELADAKERCAALFQNLGARQLEQDCFAESDDRFYAYRTLRLAVRDAPETRVLMCPDAGNPAYRAFWVETIERATEGKIPLPILWLEGAASPKSVFIAYRKAPAAILKFAAGHDQRSSSLWPLTTNHQAAREKSKAAFASVDLDDAEQKIGRLIDVVLSNPL